MVEPRYVALLFDDVHIRHGELMHARAAAERFVREALQPGDRVAIYIPPPEPGFLAFTSDIAKLTGAIEKLSAHPRMEENGIAPCPRITPYEAYFLIVSMDITALQAAVDEANACVEAPGGGGTGIGQLTTALPQGLIPAQQVQVQAEQTWDQARTISLGTLDVICAVVDQLAKMPGGRVLLLASSGFLAETLEYQQSRIIGALAANVVVNALDAKGLFADTPVRTPDQLENLTHLPMSTLIFDSRTQLPALETANMPLVNLAQSTGGLFFHNSNDLTFGFKELAAVPEITYHLGFRPGEVGEGRYHKLQVKLTRPGSYLVQTRRGYFAPAKGMEPISPRQRLDQAVSAGGALADFAASVTAESSKSKRGGPRIWVSIHVDLSGLSFKQRGAYHMQGLIFVTALMDASGNLANAKEGRMDLELTDTTFARLARTGLNARISLEAPPGTYRLREVVQEAVEGKMAASNQIIRIE